MKNASLLGWTVGANIILIAFAWLVWLISVSLYEPYPYRKVEVTAGPVATSRTVPVLAYVERVKLCPYVIHRRVFDGAVPPQKWEDTQIFGPSEVLVNKFQAPVTVDYDPVNGPALYQIQIGAMCNWLQRLWPQYGEWYSSRFTFQVE